MQGCHAAVVSWLAGHKLLLLSLAGGLLSIQVKFSQRDDDDNDEEEDDDDGHKLLILCLAGGLLSTQV